MKKKLHFLLDISEYFPILSFKESGNGISFSLINIVIPNYFINFIHIEKGKSKIFYCEEIVPSIKTDVTQKKENYIQHLQFTPDSIPIEKESLMAHIDFQRNRITAADTKANFLAAMLIVFIPLVLNIFPFLKTFFSNTLLQNIAIIMLFYYFIITLMFIIKYFYVRGVSQSSFSDLKDKKNKEIEHAAQLYYNWQCLSEYANMKVSFILNIITSLLFFIFFFFLVMILFTFTNKNKDLNYQTYEYTQVVNQKSDKTLVMFEEDHKRFEKLLLQLESQQINELIVMYPSYNMNIHTIKDEIEKHTKKIPLLFIVDETMEEGIIKFIIIKE